MGPWSRGFGPSGRKARGDIRAAILALLLEEPAHGYQLIREVAQRSEGRWEPSPGSVYPTLQQMTDEGLLISTDAEGRRVYELTEAGREAAERAPRTPWSPEAAEGDDPHATLRDLAVSVIAAARQVGQNGSAAQLAAAQEVLRDARKRLYGLLADD